jgi:hypothetical protein
MRESDSPFRVYTNRPECYDDSFVVCGVVNGVLDTQGNGADLGKLKNNENGPGPTLIRNQINLIFTAYSE